MYNLVACVKALTPFTGCSRRTSRMHERKDAHRSFTIAPPLPSYATPPPLPSYLCGHPFRMFRTPENGNITEDIAPTPVLITSFSTGYRKKISARPFDTNRTPTSQGILFRFFVRPRIQSPFSAPRSPCLHSGSLRLLTHSPRAYRTKRATPTKVPQDGRVVRLPHEGLDILDRLVRV